ncbi:MAG: ADP-ribosyltransferase [Lactobacillus equicursoris]|uniref:ADP-ribosyltransferase n=1 Tax=Lactobacillus equicursoris TaxID=420645 RepID=UPI002430DAC9|nr:ADP-ribosyltransferase [Lactobacillus equicursoris]MDD6407460.1 ADP-ribosyltransferase [Lactobacillus equicursoris]
MSTFTKKASTGISAGFTSSRFVVGPAPGSGDSSQEESQRSVFPELSKDEEMAISKYTSSDSCKINAALRHGEELDDDMKNLQYYLDSALTKLPKYDGDKPLQRDYFFTPDGANKFMSQLREGSEFIDKAYISTSKGHYGEGTEQVHVTIVRSETGRNILMYNSDKKEVLFARNTKFKVSNIKLGDDGIWIGVK